MTASQFDPKMLLDPGMYPWPVNEARLIETHISWVYLAGERVVKLKRPVDLGFVDFRDPAKRKQACEDEVRLNRRLTTDVYLGVVPVTEAGVDAPGEPIEWAVVMRRLDAERMLDALLREGKAPDDLADRLADRLIPFHASLSSSRGVPCPEGQGYKKPRLSEPEPNASSDHPACPQDSQTYLAVLTDNLDQVAEVASDVLGPEQLALVDRSMRGFLRERGDLLESRLSAWLREGHGDLRCEHICLEADAMQIYDCVEFEIAIRCADVASDLAFLVMDLRRLGAGEVSDDLLARYRAAGFDLPQPVVELYAAHRALVRAKVAALARSGRDADTDRGYAFEAASYLDIATSFACPIQPMLVLVSGLSGSGKSTVAAAIARATNGIVLSSDEARKELAGLQPTDSAANEWHQGIYTREWTARTYDRLLERAVETIERGRTAVVDATFLDNAQRERFVEAVSVRGTGVRGALAAARRSLGFARDDEGGLAAARRSLEVARDDEGGLAAARRSLDVARDDEGGLAAAKRSLDVARDDEGERDDGRGGGPVVIVWTELDDATARTRIERRARERQTASDATFEIRERQIAELAERPVRVPDGAIGVTIDTGGDGPPSLDRFFAALETAGLIGMLPGEMRHA